MDSASRIAVDEDEGVADVSDVSSTMSMRSSLLDYPVEHGRQYHRYRDGSYHRPNDERELDRLDLMHEMLLMVNHGLLFRTPLSTSKSIRILDIGAGTGIWAIDVADTLPQAEICGVDISANVPIYLPPNVHFEIDDIEDEWTFSHRFDYIHSRYMAGSIRDWPGLIQRCYENVNSGGWVEFQDFEIDYYSEDGSLTADHALRRWLTTACGAEAITGRTFRPGKHLEHWIRQVGFSKVQVERTPLPLGRWPQDKRQKKIGLYNWMQLWEGLEGMSLRLYIDILGWDRKALELLLMQVRNDLRNPAIHPIFDVYTVWAQKP